MRTASILLALCLSTAAYAQHAEPTNPQASFHFEAGLTEFKEQNYAEASKHFETAYQLEPLPDLLWSWAQSERFGGRCEHAIELYRQYENNAATPSKADAARDMIALCKKQLPHRPWYTNKLGGGVATAGLVGTTVGIVFLVKAGNTYDSAPRDEIGKYDAALREATTQRRIGAVALSIGIAGLGAAATVYVLHYRNTHVTAGTDGRTAYVGLKF